MKESKSVPKRKPSVSPSGRVTTETGGSSNPKKSRIRKQGNKIKKPKTRFVFTKISQYFTRDLTYSYCPAKPVDSGVNHAESSHSDQISDNLGNKSVPFPDQIGAEASTSSALLLVKNLGASPPHQEDASTEIRPPGIPGDVNTNLPTRLFPLSSLPDHARLNIYSKPQHLGTLFQLLKGSKVWGTLMASQFKKLWELPVSRCNHSAKLVHGLLSRQLLTNKKHELWMVYGGYPIRFSLREFHAITGLRCGPLPSESDVEAHQDPAYLSVWNRLFGSKASVTINDVLDMLRKDLVAVGDKRLTDWKKLSLALLVIIDGVVAVNNKDDLVNWDVVEMLHDTQFFMSYPWGRVSFNLFTHRFCPSTSAEIEDLRKMLKCQQSTCCYRFPLALQLQLFHCIPALCAKLKQGDDLSNFTERPSDSLSSNIMLRESHVNKVEFLPNLSVKYTVFPSEEFSEFHSTEWPAGQIHTQVPTSPLSSDDDVIEIRAKSKGKKPACPVARKPFTRSAKAKEASNIPNKQNIPKPERKQRPRNMSASHQSNEVALLKDWITEQIAMLRENIRDDMRNMLQVQLPPSTRKASTRKAADISKTPTQTKRKRKVVTSKTPKRRRALAVESLSTGSSSSDKAPSISTNTNQKVGNTGDQRWDPYGPALNITRHVNDQNPQDPHHLTIQSNNESQSAFETNPPHPYLQVDDPNLREVDVHLSEKETVDEFQFQNNHDSSDLHLLNVNDADPPLYNSSLIPASLPKNPEALNHPTTQCNNESLLAFENDPPLPCLQPDDQHLREVELQDAAPNLHNSPLIPDPATVTNQEETPTHDYNTPPDPASDVSGSKNDTEAVEDGLQPNAVAVAMDPLLTCPPSQFTPVCTTMPDIKMFMTPMMGPLMPHKNSDSWHPWLPFVLMFMTMTKQELRCLFRIHLSLSVLCCYMMMNLRRLHPTILCHTWTKTISTLSNRFFRILQIRNMRYPLVISFPIAFS